MLKENIEKLYARLERTGLTDERDRQLIRLLKDFESLPEEQKLIVLPQLEKTLARHEKIGDSQAVFRRFFRCLDEAAKDLSKLEALKKQAKTGNFH